MKVGTRGCSHIQVRKDSLYNNVADEPLGEADTSSIRKIRRFVRPRNPLDPAGSFLELFVYAAPLTCDPAGNKRRPIFRYSFSPHCPAR